MTRAQGKHREFSLNQSVATLNKRDHHCVLSTAPFTFWSSLIGSFSL